MEMTQPLGCTRSRNSESVHELALCPDGLGSVVLGDTVLAFGYLPLLHGPVGSKIVVPVGEEWTVL